MCNIGWARHEQLWDWSLGVVWLRGSKRCVMISRLFARLSACERLPPHSSVQTCGRRFPSAWSVDFVRARVEAETDMAVQVWLGRSSRVGGVALGPISGVPNDRIAEPDYVKLHGAESTSVCFPDALAAPPKVSATKGVCRSTRGAP